MKDYCFRQREVLKPKALALSTLSWQNQLGKPECELESSFEVERNSGELRGLGQRGKRRGGQRGEG